MDTSFRTIRIVHAAMLVAAVIYAILPEMVHARTRSTNPAIELVLFFIAFLAAATSLVVRNRVVTPAASQLATSAADAAMLVRWRAGNLAVFGLSEGIVLYGLVLRLLGASLLQAAALYAAGIALLLIFTPRRPA